MKFRLLVCIVFCAVPVIAFSATSDFNHPIFVGMRGEDVRALQKFLNTDTETRVADAGEGSLGKETDYFGPATRRALVKFQEKYRADVLVPVGLIKGTGYLGRKTLLKINELLGAIQKFTPLPIPTTKPLKENTTPPIEKGRVILMFPSQYSGVPSTMITIYGAGFTATDNTIYFGDNHAVVKAVSWNGQNVTFKVPAIPKGVYNIFIKNSRGESNKEQFFIVTDGVTPEPKIDSITPEQASRGDIITIKGGGFLPNGNTIRYGAGVFRNISSADGVSLSFSVPTNILMATTSPFAKKISLPMWVYIINVDGVSNGKSFILEI